MIGIWREQGRNRVACDADSALRALIAELLLFSNYSAPFCRAFHNSLDLLLERNKNIHLDREARLLLLQSNKYKVCFILAVVVEPFIS